MIGSKALSCSWPASAAKRHRDVVADHLEGDLVDDLGDHRVDLARHDRRAGLHRRQVDLARSPARGPDDSSRRSLQVFDSLTATRLSTPESWTKAPQSWVASTRFGAVTTGMPVISRR